MNSDQVYEVLLKVSTLSSRINKEAALAEHIHDQMFQNILRLAYDPFITFGQTRELNTVDASSQWAHNRPFGEHTFQLLQKLADRELTGGIATIHIEGELEKLTPESRMLFAMILNKDLRCGISDKTINKVMPGLIPTFDCMLAHKYEPKRIKRWPAIVEPKLDGVRVLAFVTPSEAKFYSRSGKEFATFNHIKEPLRLGLMNWLGSDHKKLRVGTDWIIDGEMVSGSFNKTVSEVRRKSEQATDAVFNVFDIISLTEFKSGRSVTGYSERRRELKEFVGNTPKNSTVIELLPAYLVNSETEIHTIYENTRARGLEGLIVKASNGAYECKRSHNWLKIKAEETLDLRIIDAYEGEGKYAGMLGGLIVDFNGVEVRVGGGFSDQQRQEFWEAYKQDKRAYDRDMDLLEKLCEVEYHEVTPDGSLRHPRFKRFRDDKSPLSEI